MIQRADGKHLVVEVRRDSFSPDIAADRRRLAEAVEPQTVKGRKVVAMQRWAGLNPDRLSDQVLFDGDTLHDEGKPAVCDFLLGAAGSLKDRWPAPLAATAP